MRADSKRTGIRQGTGTGTNLPLHCTAPRTSPASLPPLPPSLQLSPLAVVNVRNHRHFSAAAAVVQMCNRFQLLLPQQGIAHSVLPSFLLRSTPPTDRESIGLSRSLPFSQQSNASACIGQSNSRCSGRDRLLRRQKREQQGKRCGRERERERDRLRKTAHACITSSRDETRQMTGAANYSYLASRLVSLCVSDKCACACACGVGKRSFSLSGCV